MNPLLFRVEIRALRVKPHGKFRCIAVVAVLGRFDTSRGGWSLSGPVARAGRQLGLGLGLVAVWACRLGPESSKYSGSFAATLTAREESGSDAGAVLLSGLHGTNAEALLFKGVRAPSDVCTFSLASSAVLLSRAESKLLAPAKDRQEG